MTRVELKNFKFSAGGKHLSIDYAVLGTLPKHVQFTVVKNEDFLGSSVKNRYDFRHYNMNNFVLYVYDRQIPGDGGLSLNMDHEKTSVMGYKTVFEGSGIRHSNAGLMITHDMCKQRYFMLLFNLTPDLSASEGHMSLPENGTIRIEMTFDKALTEAITCLLDLEYEGTVRIHNFRNVTTDF